MHNPPFFIDTHAHLQDKKFTDLSSVINNAISSDLRCIINAGTCLTTSQQAIKLADDYQCCFALAGIHPHDSSTYNKDSLKYLTELSEHPKVVGIGEIGLDFHYDFSPRDVQIDVFRSLWKLAEHLKLPAIIHVREAYNEFFEAISDLPTPESVILHCYSGDLETARKALDMGFHFSIGGTLTFPNAESTRSVFRFLPAEVIHLETDCPYLAPQPKRGKLNEPSFLVHTFNKLCEIRQHDPDKLKKQLFFNAINFFAKLRPFFESFF